MSGLDNLTSKILNDATEKAAEIIKTAEEKATENYEQAMKKCDFQKKILEESAVRDRELTVERIKSNGSLKVRNEKLKAKQAVIEKVMERLKNQLVNMNEEEYMKYLENNVNFSQIGENKKLIVKKDYLNKVKEVYPSIKVSDTEFVNSGFILEENGIQENYTFEVKLDFMRDELEVEISKLLF